MGLRACTHGTLTAIGLPAARAGALLPAVAWRWSAAMGGLRAVAEPWSHGAVAPVLPASTVAWATPPALFLAAPRALGGSASDDTR